jgi:hypothetical protein
MFERKNCCGAYIANGCYPGCNGFIDNDITKGKILDEFITVLDKIGEDYQKEYVHQFNDNEIKALYRLISHQWIDREDAELMEIANRISRIYNDISRRDNPAT